MTDTPDYVQEVKNAGIKVSRYEARRFRVFLVHYDEFKEFVEKKLASASAESWVNRLTEGSEGYNEALKSGEDPGKLTARLAAELRDILDLERDDPTHMPEDLSKWMLQWASDDGLRRARMSLNTKISNRRSERSVMTLYASTRERIMKASKKHGFSSMDKYLNHLLDITGEE